MRDIKKTYYVTTDYEQFKRLKGNRDIMDARRNKLINSIETIGQMDVPILVNEKMEIIDGQGRFEAFKALNLPVPYIVQEGIGLKECQRMNIGQSNWKLRDYVLSYAEIGDNSYAYLLHLWDTFNYMPVSTVASIAKNSVEVDAKSIKRGTFSLTEAEYNAALPAFKFVDRNLLTISRLQGAGELPVAYTSLAWIYRNVDCNIDRLEKTFYDNVARFKPLVKHGHAFFMEDLGRYYNYNLSEKNEISFDGLFKIRKTKEM